MKPKNTVCEHKVSVLFRLQSLRLKAGWIYALSPTNDSKVTPTPFKFEFEY